MDTRYITVTFSFAREGDAWVGECLELGTSAYAESLRDCQKELRELVVDHLDVLEEVGERERFFQEWGIVLHPTREVPDHLTIRGSGDSWDRLFQDAADMDGPFFKPSIIPIDTRSQKQGHAVGS